MTEDAKRARSIAIEAALAGWTSGRLDSRECVEAIHRVTREQGKVEAKEVAA